MKHKHADLIHAWADGAQIEWQDINGDWCSISETPAWSIETVYRIKLEPKPDLKLYFEIAKYTSEKDKPFLFLHRECMNPENNRIDSISQNLRLIFDGETGELK